MKHYDLNIGGSPRCNLSEEDVVRLYELQEITRETACRVSGTRNWEQVNEFLPLLKYRSTVVGPQLQPFNAPRHPRVRWMLTGVAASALLIGIFAVLFRDASIPRRARSSISQDGDPARPMLPVTEFYGTGTSAPLQNPRADRPPVQPPQRPAASKRGPQQQQTARASFPAEEFTILLNEWATVPSSFGSFAAKVEDHGPMTFSVSIDYGRPRRLDKIKGFETTGENITEIHSLRGAKAYFVDRISVRPGYCVLKVVSKRDP